MSFRRMYRHLNAAALISSVDSDFPWPRSDTATHTAIGRNFEPLQNVMVPEATEIYQHHLDRAEDAFREAVSDAVADLIADALRRSVARPGLLESLRERVAGRVDDLRGHLSDLRWFGAVA